MSVAYNEIKGNTDANIKNSKLEVGGSASDLIAISNPKDNLIDDYVTKNNWTSGSLFSGRATENKSGLVVNSSATHSISSDLATIGIRATSDSPGVGISGTVNINKIDGATNAKVEKTDVAGNADTFVNASDYTNNGSFVGNAAVSGTVAIGVLWNENQVKRETNSLVDGSALNVKNLDVKADSRQGLSNLNIAVGAAIDTSSAGATFDMGYGLMRENSTVEAQISNSTLKSTSGAVNVNAENSSKIAGAFGTMGVAGGQPRRSRKCRARYK